MPDPVSHKFVNLRIRVSTRPVV